MSSTTYLYTYQPRGHEKSYQTHVIVEQRGEYDGKVLYILRPISGTWPHRSDRNGDPIPILRGIAMHPEEEQEWLRVDLVAVAPSS